MPSDSRTPGPQLGASGLRRGASEEEEGPLRPVDGAPQGGDLQPGRASFLVIPGGPAGAGVWDQSGHPPRTRTGALNRDGLSQDPGPGLAGSSLTFLNLDSNNALAQKFAWVFPLDLMDKLFGQANACLARLRMGRTNRSLAQNRLWVTRSHFHSHHCFVIVIRHHNGGWANPPKGSHSVSDSHGALRVGLEGKR